MSRCRHAWNRIEAGLAQVVLGLLAWAPLPVLLGFARLMARIVFLCWGNRRRSAIDNLRASGVATSDAEARQLALESFQAFAQMVVETLVARRRLTAANWPDFVELKLSPEAERLLHDPQRGLIAASAHLGNWEVVARAVSMVKPVCVVYRPFNNPELDRVVHAGRSGERLRLVSRLQSDPMRLMRALADGEAVALMIDQHVSDGRVQVDFFGRKAWTTKSVAMLHFATRAPLVLAVAIRRGPLRYELHALGPVTAERTGDRERDAQVLTQALTSEIERFARQYPSQYMWGHRRWKP